MPIQKNRTGVALFYVAGILTTPVGAEYDARHGRFLQRDPAGFVDGANLYEYVRNNPANWTDPSGRELQYQDVWLLGGNVIRHFYEVSAFNDQVYLGFVKFNPNDDAEVAIIAKYTRNKAALSSLGAAAKAANVGLEIALRLNPISDAAEAITGRDIVTNEELGSVDRVAAMVFLPITGVDELRDIQKVGKSVKKCTKPGKIPGSVWDLGNFPRSFEIERKLGENLPPGYPVIDRFDDGVATSIKRIDLRAATYCKNPSLITARGKEYIEGIAHFRGASRPENGDIG